MSRRDSESFLAKPGAGVGLAISASLLFAAAAAACFFKVGRLKNDAQWLLARGAAEAEAYASSFDKAMADQQMSTLEQYRAVSERALFWQGISRVFVLASVIGGVCSYILFLIARLKQQLSDATADLPPGASDAADATTLGVAPRR